MNVRLEKRNLFNKENNFDCDYDYDDALYEYKCVNCLNIEHDLIDAMKSSNEFKRSQAIADGINLLLDKIKKLERDKENLKNTLHEKENSLSNSQKEIQKLKQKILEDNNSFQMSETQTKKKLDDMNSVISGLEEKIQNLENVYKSKEKSKEEEYNSNSYKLINENKKSLELIEKLEKENKNLQNKIIEVQEQNFDKFQELNKGYQTEMDKLLENESVLNRKLKEFEILFHKLNLENVTYRECIRTFNKKYDINVILPKKIDLINELTTIESSSNRENIIESNRNTITNTNIDIVSSRNLTDTFSFSKENFNPNSLAGAATLLKNFSSANLNSITEEEHEKNIDLNLNDMNNIEDVSEEIRKTESLIKRYSLCLKSLEEGTGLKKEEEFKECMKILEEKTDYLISLKKKYNMLYKQMII